jgi:hypothetical protein
VSGAVVVENGMAVVVGDGFAGVRLQQSGKRQEDAMEK